MNEIRSSQAFRCTARVVLAVLLWGTWPAESWAAVADNVQKAAEPPSRLGNHKMPAVQAPPMLPRLSDPPTDLELFKARVFEEPLVPEGAGTPDENRAFGTALTTYIQAAAREDISSLERYLAEHPASPWNVALMTNLAIVSRRTGYFSKTLHFSQQAWEEGKDSPDPRVQALAARALSEMAELWARLGRVDDLEALLAAVEGREFVGSVAERMDQVRQSAWMMENRPDESFRCGPLAVEHILKTLTGRTDARVEETPSTRAGTSLLQMHALAATVGLRMKMARRESIESPILVPSMVHWKSGHFAALVKEEGDRFLLQDPTFGDEMWVSRKAINEEADGYFLVVEQRLPVGWRLVEKGEGGTVWGKGAPPGQNPQNQTCPDDPTNGGNSCPVNEPCPMATYTFQDMLASLKITDTPLRYDPPFGPASKFGLTYNQREAFQPAIFSYSNVGPMWTFGGLSYVTDDPSNAAQTVTVYGRGGGQETFASTGGGTFQIHYKSRAVLVRTATSPITYERRLPNGYVEVFSQPDGSIAFPRKVLLTEERDPAGNKQSFIYDADLRMVGMADALGQVTTLSYELPLDPLKITRVTDPFGRFARLDYDSSGRLQRITDTIGLTSEFTYGAGSFITSLTTPYGTSTFTSGQTGADRWIEATDPLGGKERMQYVNGHSPILPPTVPANTVPAGFESSNHHFDTSFTLYWDKRAMALAPGDPSKALQRHWMWAQGTAYTVAVLRTEKKALENRVWFSYPGQTPGSNRVGSDSRPKEMARVLDDGTTTQSWKYENNVSGKACKTVDPLNRETRYTYGTNNVPDPVCATGSSIDLLKVEQKNGSAYDLVETSTFSAQHLPLTVKDIAGQTTTYSYNGRGQLDTLTRPRRAGIPERTHTKFIYDNNGYLQTATRPQRVPLPTASSAFAYDAYGRLRTVTDQEGYVQTFEYDVIDRTTRAIYPDGTYEESVYNRLDAERQRDRLGRWSHTVHDAMRRPVALRDPAGRTTTLAWCACGSLDRLIDANGNATSWDRDLQGRVTREVRANGSAKLFTYETTTSRLKEIRDAKNQVTQFSYFLDDKARQVSYVNAQYPTSGVDYGYTDPATSLPDAYGRLRQLFHRSGIVAYAYHPVSNPPTVGAGRLASDSRAIGSADDYLLAYTYDELGRVVSRVANNVTTSWAYDALGRLRTLTDPIGTFQYTYEGATNRAQSLTYPNGQVSMYAYHPNAGDHRLQEIHHKQPGAGTTLAKFNYLYDAVGNIKTWTQQSGTSAWNEYGLGYDAVDQLTSAVNRPSNPTSPPLKRYGYAYDAAANRTTEQIDDAATQASYDAMNRLSSTQPGGSLVFQGSLNEAGMVTVQARSATVTPPPANVFSGSATVPPGTSTVEVKATDGNSNVRTNTYQVTQAGASQAFTHDANGNLTSQRGHSYEWDAENRLVRARNTVGNIEIASFDYDALGRRLRKSAGDSKTYIYDGDAILEERIDSAPTKRYVHGPGIDQPLAVVQNGVASYYVTDHLGSVVRVTDQAGNPVLTRDYDPWGNPLAGAGSEGYAFTGREWDPETGLYYFRARYFDPKIGRFISEDPIGLAGGDVNFYAYVWNNPVNWIDPSGLRGNRPSGRVPSPLDSPPPNIGMTSSQMAQQAVGRPPNVPGGLRDLEDALRHCLASCWYTITFGPSFATAVGNILESKSMVAGTQTVGDINMDLSNNAVGRQCGAGATSPDDCLTRCRNQALTGNLIFNVPAGGPYP